MTAGEDQAEAVILQRSIVQLRSPGVLLRQPLREGSERTVEPSPPPELVDRLEAAGRDQPGPGIVGQPGLRPPRQSSRERILERFLGQIEISEEAYEGRQNPARLGTVELLDGATQHRTPRSGAPRPRHAGRREFSRPPGSRR